MNESNCPILADAARVVELGKETTKALRKLKRDLRACKTCPAGDDCAVLKNFHAQVESAIAELSEEWNLVP